MTYTWQCPECGWKRDVQCSIADRDKPQFCNHVTEYPRGDRRCTMVLMRRIPARFLFTANRAVDDPANDKYRVLGARDKTEALEMARAEEKQTEEHVRAFESSIVPGTPSESMLDNCDVQGAWTAAHAGPEQLERWRRDNIPNTDFTKEEVAAANTKQAAA